MGTIVGYFSKNKVIFHSLKFGIFYVFLSVVVVASVIFNVSSNIPSTNFSICLFVKHCINFTEIL